VSSAMGSVALVVTPGATIVVACVLALCVGGAAVVASSRSARRRRDALDDALNRSKDEVESLSRRVEQLSDEVVRARRTADQDREYVITSLGSDDGRSTLSHLTTGAGGPLPEMSQPGRTPVSRVLEDQLVEALARQPRSSMVRTRAVELVVRTVALGHGVRRAMSADVLDRAAAEAHVARRRSRRERKRQLRQARRVVTEAGPARQADQGSGQEVA
jgi:hypothetical protein